MYKKNLTDICTVLLFALLATYAYTLKDEKKLVNYLKLCFKFTTVGTNY